MVGMAVYDSCGQFVMTWAHDAHVHTLYFTLVCVTASSRQKQYQTITRIASDLIISLVFHTTGELHPNTAS
jgi:hypothetical protein